MLGARVIINLDNEMSVARHYSRNIGDNNDRREGRSIEYNFENVEDFCQTVECLKCFLKASMTFFLCVLPPFKRFQLGVKHSYNFLLIKFRACEEEVLSIQFFFEETS